jgi:hypothetical protein
LNTETLKILGQCHECLHWRGKSICLLCANNNSGILFALSDTYKVKAAPAIIDEVSHPAGMFRQDDQVSMN